MITVVKSRTTFDAKLIPMIYDCDNGFDSLRSLIQYGLDKGIITGNRASMKFTADPECKFSYVRLYEDLKSKPEILQNLTKFVVPDLEKPFAVDHAPDQFMQVFMEY